MKKIFLASLILFLATSSFAQVNVDQFTTPDDVTIAHLEDQRQQFQGAINSADGALMQDESVTAAKLDDNANPENRWDEAFSDFVFTGLLPTTSSSLTTTTPGGTAYISGTRVVKADTAKTYTAWKYTYIDLSNTGVFTYQATTYTAVEPGVTTESIRLARLSTDGTQVTSVRDDRVTSLTTIAVADKIIDTSGQTQIQTQETASEQKLRFDTNGSQRAVMDSTGLTLTVPISTSGTVASTGNMHSAGSVQGFTMNAVTSLTAGSADITGNISNGTLSSISVSGSTATGEVMVNNVTDDIAGLGSQGTSGQFLQSQGAGVNPTWGNSSLVFVSNTAISSTTTSGNIAISQDEAYIVLVEVIATDNADAALTLQFNADSGSKYANVGEARTSSTSVSLASIGRNSDPASAFLVFYFNTTQTDQMVVTGQGTYIDTGNLIQRAEITGWWDNSDTVTTFVVLSSANVTGNVILYRIPSS